MTKQFEVKINLRLSKTISDTVLDTEDEVLRVYSADFQLDSLVNPFADVIRPGWDLDILNVEVEEQEDEQSLKIKSILNEILADCTTMTDETFVQKYLDKIKEVI